jgi:hypothetical protein
MYLPNIKFALTTNIRTFNGRQFLIRTGVKYQFFKVSVDAGIMIGVVTLDESVEAVQSFCYLLTLDLHCLAKADLALSFFVGFVPRYELLMGCLFYLL